MALAPALTSLSHGAGCGCKLSAADLRPILASLPLPTDPRVLVSARTADDAGVVQLSEGIAIVGGHSIDDPEPKYGMAVTGVVDPRAVLTNAGGRAGDSLVLTKPLGAGAVATALKRGLADAELIERAIAVMTTLNDRASA